MTPDDLARRFTALGTGIDARWRAAAYDVALFPYIAADALREARLEEELTPDDILHWVLASELPEQFDIGASFGEPPVTLFRSDRFFVQALFWYHGSTAIHHHGFSGAFAVLSGESIHTTWSFDVRRRVNQFLLFGDLRQRSAGLIRRGAVEAIDAELIHCVFHLEVPSVTIVVRTFSDFLPHPQYTYLKPHVAMYAPGRAQTLVRRLQTLRLMVRMGHPALEREVLDLLARSDLQSAFFLCEELFPLVETSLFDRMLATLDADPRELAPVFAHARREDVLMRVRAGETDEDLRFFLALLLTLDRRADVAALVQQRTGTNDPLETIAAWVSRLARSGSIEIPADPINETICRLMLHGTTDDDILRALANEHGDAAVREQESALRQQFDLFRLSVLAPLFVR